MKITAIAAEYNPLHSGHVKQLRTARTETDCDALAVVLDGWFTQRGEVASAPPEIRADWAVNAGADVVLLSPTVLSLSNADNFAYGAVKTLRSAFPDDDITLSFGSESGDIRTLTEVARLLQNESEEFSAALKARLKEGKNFPRSRAETFAEFYPEYAGVLDKPNNILALEYIRHGVPLGFSFHTVKRENEYDSDSLDGDHASAGAIRKAWETGVDASRFLPPFVEPSRRDCSVLYEKIMENLQRTTAPQLAETAEIREGLENRMKRFSSLPYEEFLQAVKTKRFTMAAIKRMCLLSYLGVDKKLVTEARSAETLPVVVLAESDSAKKLHLSEAKINPSKTTDKLGEKETAARAAFALTTPL